MRTIKRDIVGAFIFSRDGLLLMGKSHGGSIYAGRWIVPGGGVDAGETKLQALLREILEETGLDISGSDVQQIDYVFSGKAEKVLRDNGERVMADMTFYNFTVRLDQLAAEISLTTEDDFVDPKWFALSELPLLPMSPASVKTLKKLGHL